MGKLIRIELLVMAWAAAGLLPVRAQYLLYAENQGQSAVVVRVDGNTPFVLVGEKAVAASSRQYALRQVGKFAPYYVTVRDFRVDSNATEFVGDTRDLNNEISFHAEFESGYRLDDVFLVLELQDERQHRSMLVREVGALEPRVPRTIGFDVPLALPVGAFTYSLHVFAGGPEIFSSTLPPGVINDALDRLTREKLSGVKSAPPQPLLGPSPLYPKSLLKKRVAGSATVSFLVTPSGLVWDPVLKEATEPAFGEAALRAIREWRFLPKVVDGHPIEAKVSLPFTFAPPPTKAP